MTCGGIATTVKNFVRGEQLALQFEKFFDRVPYNLCLHNSEVDTSESSHKGVNWQVNKNRRVQCQNLQSPHWLQRHVSWAHARTHQIAALKKSLLSWCLSPLQQNQHTQVNTSNFPEYLSARADLSAPLFATGTLAQQEVPC